MAASALYAPPRTIPGVTAPHAFQRRLPDVLEAIKERGPDGKLTDENAKKLDKVAGDWFAAWRWFRSEATECRAHYAGQQYGYLDDKSGLWIGNTLDADEDRVRVTVNVSKACVDQAVAMLTGDAAILRAAAGQPGIAASAAAEVARAFLDDSWRQHNLDDIYRDTGKVMFTVGISYVLLEWDKTAGPLKVLGYRPAAPNAPTDDDEDDQPALPGGVDAATGALMPPGAPPGLAGALTQAPIAPPVDLEPIEAPQGDLRYRMLMDEQVAHDPASRRRGGQDGIGICVKWREPRARILEIRPDLFDELPESGTSSHDQLDREERTQRASSFVDGTRGGAKRNENEDTLEVIVFYLRSRTNRRRGDCIMVCEGKILWHGENDIYPTEEETKRGELWPSENWPVFDFVCDTRENCPVGRGRMVDAIPIQAAINGGFSKLVQHIGIMANVKYALPAGLDWEPTDEPGQVARIAARFYAMTGNDPIKMTSPPQISAEYRGLVDLSRQLLEVVVGVNAASMGASPTADASGRLSQSLQQRDNTRLAPIKRSHDNQWARVQTFALRLFRRHDPDGKRMLRVIGQDNAVQMKFFSVADLAAGTEVYAVNDTSLPREPQARILALGTIMDKLAQAKSPEIQDAYLELLNLPDLIDWKQRRSPHQQKAIWLTRKLMLGEGDGSMPPQPQMGPTGQPMPDPNAPPPNCPIPAPWDNPMIFKAELERFACSVDYLDKVAQEKSDPANQGQSPLEQRVVYLWTYYSQHAIPAQPQPIVKLEGKLTPEQTAQELGGAPPTPQPMAQAA